MTSGAVGVFWAIQLQGGEVCLLCHICSEPESYGSAWTCPHGHYELWEQWRRVDLTEVTPELRSVLLVHEYEEWPRGRVVYSTRDERFTVYADEQIRTRRHLLREIEARFGLPATQTTSTSDSHYRSTYRIRTKR
jgi:hypothetical protein